MQKLQVQGVHHITLVGADRQTSIDFWEGVLGMPFIFEQPNLDVPEESHLYFDPGDGRLITIFTNENRKPDPTPTPNEIGAVHHIAFWVSRATFAQAVDRLDRRGIQHSGVKDRGFMDSIYFRDPLGLLVELAAYRFFPPEGVSHGEVLYEAHKIRVARGDYNITEAHLADAIEDLIRRKRHSLSDDREPKDPYAPKGLMLAGRPIKTTKAGRNDMKLYMHPASNTSRPVVLFIEENNLPVEMEMVDLMAGAHLQPPYLAVNPNGLVPALVDGDFTLTESSAILKYLADKFDLPTYPKDLKTRAKVNELMDWFNTGFYRDYAYGVVYPQIFPHHKRESDEVQKATIAWGKARTERWLKVLNDHWLGHGNPYLTGDTLTIADLFGAGLVTCGHPIRSEFKAYPNVEAWLKRIEALPNWGKINAALDGFREALKDQAFETV